MIIVICAYRIIMPDSDEYSLVEKDVLVEGSISAINETSSGKRLVLHNPNVIRGTVIESGWNLLIYVSSISENLRIGNYIRVSGKAGAFERAGNPGQFDAYSYYLGQGYAYSIMANNIIIIDESYDSYGEFIRSVSDSISNRLYTYLPENDAGIMTAMILGNRAGIDDNDRQLYKDNGLMHLLAVSALHVSMISMMLLWVIERLPVGFVQGRIIVIIMLYIYGCIAGFSVSCTRAIIMMVCSIVARLTSKAYDGISAMALSAIIVLLMRPTALFGCDFLLSYMAVAAIMISNDILGEIKYFKALAISVGVTLMTMPVVLCNYYDSPLYSVFLNLIVLPLMSVLLVTALLCGLALMPMLVAGTVHYILELYRLLCNLAVKYVYEFRITACPGIGRVLVYYILLVIMIAILRRVSGKIRIALMIGGTAFLILIMSIRINYNGMDITMLDVGQGDGIYISCPEGQTVFIDGGSSDEKDIGKYIILPFLMYKGVRSVDIWIITHADSDHYSGFVDMLEYVRRGTFRIECLWLPDIVNPSDNYLMLIDEAKKCGIKIKKIAAGDMIKSGNDIKFTCLNPVRGLSADSENEYSLTLLMEWESFSALFTGDVENRAEAEVIRRMQGIDRVNLLKCAHHGSSGSTSKEFCDAVKADVAWISSGRDNSYGHPHPETIERLRHNRTIIYRTDECGAINMRVNEGKYYIRRFK